MKQRYFKGIGVAIGDGGNDMNMLEAARVGIAIARGLATDSKGKMRKSSKDKMRAKGVRSGAVLSCDMSIPNFGMLPRLVQVVCTVACVCACARVHVCVRACVRVAFLGLIGVRCRCTAWWRA